MKTRRFWSWCLLLTVLLASSCAVQQPPRHRHPRPPYEAPHPGHPGHPRHPEKPKKPKKPKKHKKGEMPPPPPARPAERGW